MKPTMDVIQRCLEYALSPTGVKVSVIWEPFGLWAAVEKGEAEAPTGRRRLSSETHTSVRGHLYPSVPFSESQWWQQRKKCEWPNNRQCLGEGTARLSAILSLPICLSHLGCCNKIPQTVWLQQWTFLFS